MSGGYVIEADGLLYRIVDDLTISYQAIFTASLVDETTGGPIISQPLLSTNLAGLSLRAVQDGLTGGAAYVEQVFPKLATTAYNVVVQISSEGYRDTTFTVNVPIAAVFPLATAPVIMRRLPVRLQGKVVKASDRASISGALVASKNNKTPLLRDVVRSGHNSGVSVVSLSFTTTGPARKLNAAILSPAAGLVLDNNAGLGPGDHLQIGAGASAEIFEISAVGPDPGVVVMTSALTTSFAAGTAVQQVTPSATSGSTTLARSSDTGDGVLVLTAALSDKAIGVIDGLATEYHWLNALSGPDGYYHVNGITGVKSLELLCSAAGFITFDQPWMPQYSDSVNVVDFRLRP